MFRMPKIFYIVFIVSKSIFFYNSVKWQAWHVRRLCYRWENIETVVSLRAKTGRDAGDRGDSRWTDHRAKTRAACFRVRQTWSVCVPRNTVCEFTLRKKKKKIHLKKIVSYFIRVNSPGREETLEKIHAQRSRLCMQWEI